MKEHEFDPHSIRVCPSPPAHEPVPNADFDTGHGDVAAGVVVGRDETLRRRVYREVELLGATADPFASRLHVGLEAIDDLLADVRQALKD